jgi:all-trans-retinol 13,14-reductase
MRIGTSYKQETIEGSFDAIVIGSGIGGLTTAALLTVLGEKRVLVLERHYTAGGFTHTFHRPGYEWDVGVHYIGQLGDADSPMRQLFDAISNGRLEWSDMGDVYDKIIIENDAYEFPRGREAFREQMHAYFPAERDAIDAYIARVVGTVRRAGLYFAEKSLPAPLSRLIGGAMRWPLLRRAKRTTRETLSALTNNQRMIGVLTGQYGDYGLPPSRSSFFMHALIAAHYFDGAAYPVGGASRIAATIVPVIEHGGGRVFTSADVEEILVEGGRAKGVRLTDGHELRAPIVVSDAGLATTVRRLLPVSALSELNLDNVLDRHEPSTAHLCLYLGFRGTREELGLGKTNLWVYPHHDHDRNVERYFADADAALPFAYISFPSAKDPDFERRFPGRATVEVITIAPYEWFRRWERDPWKNRGAEYQDLKEKFTERLLAPLFAHCPQLRGRIDYMELSTPLTTRHFTGHASGEIYGLAATPGFFADRSLRPRPPIRGLFLTGADVCTLGVGGAMFGGLLAASSILGRDLRRAVAKEAESARNVGAQEARAAHFASS